MTETTIWETRKVHMRKRLIALAAKTKKQKVKALQEFTDQLDQLEKQHQISHDKKLLQEIIKLQQKIELLETEEMSINLKFIKQRFFEHANKPRKLLANQFKK